MKEAYQANGYSRTEIILILLTSDNIKIFFKPTQQIRNILCSTIDLQVTISNRWLQNFSLMWPHLCRHYKTKCENQSLETKTHLPTMPIRKRRPSWTFISKTIQVTSVNLMTLLFHRTYQMITEDFAVKPQKSTNTKIALKSSVNRKPAS